MRKYLEVDAVVEALPDEEAPDVTAAGQPVVVHIDAKQAAMSLVLDPVLILVGITCTGRREGGNMSSVRRM